MTLAFLLFVVISVVLMVAVFVLDRRVRCAVDARLRVQAALHIANVVLANTADATMRTREVRDILQQIDDDLAGAAP